MVPLPLPWLTLTRIGIGVFVFIASTVIMLYVAWQAQKRGRDHTHPPTYLPTCGHAPLQRARRWLRAALW